LLQKGVKTSPLLEGVKCATGEREEGEGAEKKNRVEFSRGRNSIFVGGGNSKRKRCCRRRRRETKEAGSPQTTKDKKKDGIGRGALR